MYIKWYVFVLFSYIPKVISDEVDQIESMEKLIEKLRTQYVIEIIMFFTQRLAQTFSK